MFIIKFAIYFSLSFIILSFPVGNKPIFNHLNKVAQPYTTELFSSFFDKAKDNIQRISSDDKVQFKFTESEIKGEVEGVGEGGGEITKEKSSSSSKSLEITEMSSDSAKEYSSNIILQQSSSSDDITDESIEKNLDIKIKAKKKEGEGVKKDEKQEAKDEKVEKPQSKINQHFQMSKVLENDFEEP